VVTMKNAIIWVVTLCGSCKNRRFGGTYRHHHQRVRNKVRLLIAINVVPSSPILVTLMEEIRSSKTLDLKSRTASFPIRRHSS
jgi:hypothetical protein